MSPRANSAALIESRVAGSITTPELSEGFYVVDRDGRPLVPVGPGGIHYNLKVGMPVFGWAADQAHPGVSIENPEPAANLALSTFACIGNAAEVRSGAAAGAVGAVTGKHEAYSSFRQVILDFPSSVLQELVPGDEVVVRARGVGLRLDDFPGVTLHSLGPELWERWSPESRDAGLALRVVAVVPPQVVGIGSGRLSASTSLALQLDDPALAAELRLERLRIGDLVAVRDWDARFHTGYRPGATTVGAIVNSSSRQPGFGPSITILASSRGGELVPVVDPEANLANLLAVGMGRP